MQLYSLLHRFFNLDEKAYKGIEVSGICTDTRELKKGDLFILQEGERVDTHDVYEQLEDKAVAFISEKKIDTQLPCFLVHDANEVIGPVAARFYGDPTENMTNIAVTGTNGKTSVTFILAHLLQAHEKNVGLIGTNGIYMNNESIVHNNKTPTTPPPLELQKIGHEFHQRAAHYNIMEVTSHGLHFDRAKSIDFTYRLFTNLTPDHLDFHPSMTAYFRAKSKLFVQAKQDEYCILNKDSTYFEELQQLSNGKVISYGTAAGADFRATNIELNEQYSLFDVTYADETIRMQSSLVGMFNIVNLLAAIAVARLEGIALTDIQAYLTTFTGIGGRMQRVILDDKVIVVDFAHTPDALENALQTLSAIKKNRLITVFGCGGDRDRAKRPVMGAIAEKYSDQVMLTSDNPRTEDPEAIIDDIVAGMTNEVERITDRRMAIHEAMNVAEPSDIILIAGKGNETTQIIGREEYLFDDIEVAKAYRG